MQDYETWIIDIGDEVIHRKASIGFTSLTDIEKAIYCFWVIDYAVRNSGTLEPMRELYPTAISELKAIAVKESWIMLSALLSIKNESEFCDNYYLSFDKACSELARNYAHT